MDIKRVKHLVALADSRNFGCAAALCHLSQSAFSRSIQTLEDELGLQLFVRSTHDVRCTPAGEFVLERARANCCLKVVACSASGSLPQPADGRSGFWCGPYPAVGCRWRWNATT